MNGARYPVSLVGLPKAPFERAVTYLADVLRECQLTLIESAQGVSVDPALLGVAQALVPDLEEMREVFRAASFEEVDGRLDIRVEIERSLAATVAHLQHQLRQLRYLGSSGGFLLTEEAEVTDFIGWLWDELSDQLDGRAQRPYRTR